MALLKPLILGADGNPRQLASGEELLTGLTLLFSAGINGGGLAITPGSKGVVRIPFACTCTGWSILADQTGSIVIDVKASTYAAFPTTASIAGSEKPTLSGVRKNEDASITTWTAIALGDVLEFYVDSCSGITAVTINLSLKRS